ncbi:hypothetical protein HYH03_006377 [Edaphochlamys debaryana]|uniref:Glycosyltransferase family 92 protein n=1 Tax=Edaphochlamys debaryana TaxID=47281 RepID=A0A836C078_9CHLO|nr:hypothetical protein HYH03_006377 [Edaphochlamys debaryana]|eukprot:KAG2495430.1 hypothetical protein HYH03_006377 [Edaphochlamys debaryana]
MPQRRQGACQPRILTGLRVALTAGLLIAFQLFNSAATAAAAEAGATAAAGASKDYSALCVVGRNENRYVKEWVDYHKCLGFSRIYVYDHNSTVPLSEPLMEHMDSGFVEYINFSGAHRKFKSGYTSDLDRFMATIQGQAYKDCVERFGSRHTFLGFIDFDEFLVIYDQNVTSVNDLLKDYEAFPGVSFYWVLLGSSGHVARQSPVVDAFTKCTPHSHKFNTQFKTFANTRFRPTMYSPHRAIFNATPGPDGQEPYMVNEHKERIQRGRNKVSTHDRATVFHYVVKSLEDFNYKMKRGGGAGVTRPKYYFNLMDKYSKDTCDGALATRARFCGTPMPKIVGTGRGKKSDSKKSKSSKSKSSSKGDK